MSKATLGFKDDSNGTLAGDPVDDYQYDLNGNMTQDQNKNITSIAYNHINLPTKITFSTGSNIVYVYDATGVKLKKVVTVSPTVTTTEYLSGFQYTNNVLQFFPTAEGYVKHTLVGSTSKFNYVYNYTDHLGNVRVSYTKDPTTGTLKIIEENHNYPFGLKHNYNNTDYEFTVSGSNVVLTQVSENKYNYQYNGKEFQDELGLNWYDYQARNYDPAIGRWFNIDPASEVSRRFSPYTYALNNSVYFIDPDGMIATPADGDPLRNLQIRENRASNLFRTVRTNDKGTMNSKNHQGFDYTASTGTEALAVKNGTVHSVDCTDDSDYGISVTLSYQNEDGDTRYAFYAHMSDVDVAVGTEINEGDVIGKTGVSGNASSNSPHLHFEVRTEPSPGLGLAGRESPNNVTDTKFFSQDDSSKTSQTTTGVIKIEKTEGGGMRSTNMNLDSTTSTNWELRPISVTTAPIQPLQSTNIKPLENEIR